MKEQTSKIALNIIGLQMAIFSFALPASCTLMPSTSEYQLVCSVVDNGGGRTVPIDPSNPYSVEGSIGQNMLPPNLGLTTGGVYSNRVGVYNPPHFIYQRVLKSSLDMVYNTQLTIPANAVVPAYLGDKDVFDIIINKKPDSNPVNVDPRTIVTANDKIVHNEGAWSQAFPDSLTEVQIFDEQNYYSKPLAAPGILTLRYNDTNGTINGVTDGSVIRTDSLHAWGLDETSDSWAQMSGVSLDMNAKTLTFSFGMPGVYALLGMLDQELKHDLKAYPVPFRPNGPNAGNGAGQTGTESDGITFKDVPEGGKIEIYTLDGRLVKKIDIPLGLGFPWNLKWDVKTASGERAASGVYIWRVVSGGNSKFGKLMVIW